MSALERRLLYLGITLLFLAFTLWLSNGGSFNFPIPIAQASGPTYYGADLSAGGGMEKATGVSTSNRFGTPTNSPWPQRAGNYCFLATVQALVNYEVWKTNHNLVQYPLRSYQGPSPPDPAHPWENGTPVGEQSPQILWYMDTNLKPTFGTLPIQGSGQNRRPFTLANSSYDFGGDPRSQAVAMVALTGETYHMHVFHTGVSVATYKLAVSVTWSYSGGASPSIALVNQAKHAVVVAGVWSFGNVIKTPSAKIDSFAIYNPWDEQWGAYINGAYYERVSYASWTQGQSTENGPFGPGYAYWWKKPYSSNGGLDPDPLIGMYQAGPGTKHPSAHFWIGNYVTIFRDSHSTYTSDYAFNENGQPMTGP
jgi:hypothetical protein